MSILLIAVIALIVIFAIIGYVKGLLGVLFNIFSWIFIAFFVIVTNPYIYTFIVQNTGWAGSISNSAKTYVDSTIDKTVGSTIGNVPSNSSASTNDIEDFLSKNGITLPEVLSSDVVSDVTNSLKDTTNGAISDASNQVTQVKDSIVTGVADTVASYIIKGISCLIAFVIAKIICWIVYAIIKHVQDMPIIHGVCSWIGMFLGVIKGLFITWLFMFIVSITTATSFGQYFMPMIEKSTFLTYLYENNLLITLFYYFF